MSLDCSTPLGLGCKVHTLILIYSAVRNDLSASKASDSLQKYSSLRTLGTAPRGIQYGLQSFPIAGTTPFHMCTAIIRRNTEVSPFRHRSITTNPLPLITFSKSHDTHHLSPALMMSINRSPKAFVSSHGTNRTGTHLSRSAAGTGEEARQLVPYIAGLFSARAIYLPVDPVPRNHGMKPGHLPDFP